MLYQLSYFPIKSSGISLHKGIGKDRIWTYEELRSADLQSTAFDHSATFPKISHKGRERSHCDVKR
jgi:hypothetical protein